MLRYIWNKRKGNILRDNVPSFYPLIIILDILHPYYTHFNFNAIHLDARLIFKSHTIRFIELIKIRRKRKRKREREREKRKIFSSFRAHWKLQSNGWTGGCIPGLIAGKNKRWFISNRIAFPPPPSSTRCTLPEFLKYGGRNGNARDGETGPNRYRAKYTYVQAQKFELEACIPSSPHPHSPRGRINFRQPKGRNGGGKGRFRGRWPAANRAYFCPRARAFPPDEHAGLLFDIAAAIRGAVGGRGGVEMGEPVCYYCT